MTMIKIRTIVDDAIEVVGEATGSGVQTYSEDRVMKDAIRGFNMIFKKYYWPQYTDWVTIAVDGTTGVPTTDWGYFVRDIEDILLIYKNKTEHRIPMLPNLRNPVAMVSGGSIQYWKALPSTHTNFMKRRFRFYPPTATGSLDVLAKFYPCNNDAVLNFDDSVDIDHDMLVAGTAFMTLSADDLNPGAADAQRNMMEQRYKDIMGSLANEPIRVSGSGSTSGIPDQWFVSR